MFVNYIFAKTMQLPPYSGGLYEYVVAKNAIYVRAERPGLSAMIPAAAMIGSVRGLYEAGMYVSMARRVPAYVMAQMVIRSYYAGRREMLFYVLPDPWRLATPSQVAGAVSVRPSDPYSGEMAAALIEVHSHHVMRPYFSNQDNRDERSGFRIFTVIGDLGGNRPAVLTRVGIYGHFWEIPSSWVYEMPAGLVDMVEDEI